MHFLQYKDQSPEKYVSVVGMETKLSSLLFSFKTLQKLKKYFIKFKKQLMDKVRILKNELSLYISLKNV